MKKKNYSIGSGKEMIDGEVAWYGTVAEYLALFLSLSRSYSAYLYLISAIDR